MDRKEIAKRLADSFGGLQQLDSLPPTRHNMEVLLSALYAIQDAYKALEDEDVHADIT